MTIEMSKLSNVDWLQKICVTDTMITASNCFPDILLQRRTTFQ